MLVTSLDRIKQILSSVLFLIACLFFIIAGLHITERWVHLPDFLYTAIAEKQINNIDQDFELFNNNQEFIPHNQIPDQLIIPSLNIDLPIEMARFHQENWSISRKGVSMMLLPSQPTPQYVLYGHNWPKLLGNLSDIQIGEEIILLENGQELLTAKIVDHKVYMPNQFSELIGASDVIIYTCTGWFDRERLVVFAKIY